MLEVDVPGQVDRPRAHRDLERPGGDVAGDPVEVGEPDRAVGDRAVVDHPAPVGQQRRLLVPVGDADRVGVLLFGRLEAADALVHVPAEGADPADVVVEAHLAVGHDVQPGVLLVPDHRGRGVGVGLGVRRVLERHAGVTAEQLVRVPVRSRV